VAANCAPDCPGNSGQLGLSVLNAGGLLLVLFTVFVAAEVFSTAEEGLGLRHVHPALGAAHHVLGSGRTHRAIRPLQIAEIIFQEQIENEDADQQNQKTHRDNPSAKRHHILTW